MVMIIMTIMIRVMMMLLMMIIAIFGWTSSNFIAWLPSRPAGISGLWLPDDASDDAFHTDTEDNDEDNEGFHATHVKQ